MFTVHAKYFRPHSRPVAKFFFWVSIFANYPCPIEMPPMNRIMAIKNSFRKWQSTKIFYPHWTAGEKFCYGTSRVAAVLLYFVSFLPPSTINKNSSVLEMCSPRVRWHVFIETNFIFMFLTTRNSFLSTLSFPSVSNILKAMRNPVCGSANHIMNGRLENLTACIFANGLVKLCEMTHSWEWTEETGTPCMKLFL